MTVHWFKGWMPVDHRERTSQVRRTPKSETTARVSSLVCCLGGGFAEKLDDYHRWTRAYGDDMCFGLTKSTLMGLKTQNYGSFSRALETIWLNLRQAGCLHFKPILKRRKTFFNPCRKCRVNKFHVSRFPDCLPPGGVSNMWFLNKETPKVMQQGTSGL